MQEKLNLVIELQKLIVKINNFVQHIDEPEYLVDLVSGDLLKQYRRERIEEAARAWRNLTDEAKLLGLRFHDLRHHCITKLAEAGVPDQTLMSIAGHLNRQMLEHYSHIRMQAKRDAVAALDRRPAQAESAPVAPAKEMLPS
jgi:integrase